MVVTLEEITMTEDPKQPLEYIPHSDGTNGSFLSPENRAAIDEVKDRLKNGDSEGVDKDTQDAFDNWGERLVNFTDFNAADPDETLEE